MTSETPMTHDELMAWFLARGVRTKAEAETWAEQYRGKTLDEMEELYASIHGPMA